MSGATTAAVAWPLRLYADMACALCRAEMCGLVARDEGARLQVVDCSALGFRDAELEAAGISRTQLLQRLHARDAQGRWLVGVPVFAAAYEAAGLHRVAWLLRLHWLQPVLSRGYGLVADHRVALVRLGTPRLLAWLLARDGERATAASPRA